MASFAPLRILAATDFSDSSTWALRHAAMWAHRFGADLVGLHVAEMPCLIGDFGSVGGLILSENREAAAHRLAGYMTSTVPPGIPMTHTVRSGAVPDVLEAHAIDGQAGLVVIGASGPRGCSRRLLGSVAERVLHTAPYPVLMVHGPSGAVAPPETGPWNEAEEAGAALEPAAPRLTHVLCPVNDTEVARAQLAHAVSIARAFGARLTALSVVEQEARAPASGRRAEARLRSWLPAVTAGYPVQTLVGHGDAAEQILLLARQAAADLVVIGARHRRFLDTTVLGVTTVRVTRHASCPVLVVPWASGG